MQHLKVCFYDLTKKLYMYSILCLVLFTLSACGKIETLENEVKPDQSADLSKLSLELEYEVLEYHLGEDVLYSEESTETTNEETDESDVPAESWSENESPREYCRTRRNRPEREDRLERDSDAERGDRSEREDRLERDNDAERGDRSEREDRLERDSDAERGDRSEETTDRNSQYRGVERSLHTCLKKIHKQIRRRVRACINQCVTTINPQSEDIRNTLRSCYADECFVLPLPNTAQED
jgi:hypothetical protein